MISTFSLRKAMSCLMLLSLSLTQLALPGLVNAQAPAPADPRIANPMQFKSGDSLIDFRPDRVIMGSPDHPLVVDFLEAQRVTPEITSPGSSLPTPNSTHPVNNLGTVTYPELWHGIDLSYSGAQGNLPKSTFTVGVGADPAQIAIMYHLTVTLNSQGSLSITYANGILSESAPVAWQIIGGRQNSVSAAFTVKPADHGTRVGFKIGAYNPHFPLVIDPAYVWHTFYGGPNPNDGNAIAVDADGAIYITGSSTNTWNGPLPATTLPIHLHDSNPLQDIFIMKLDKDGTYLWHTFYGSAKDDIGWGIAVDASYVYITGMSQNNWLGGLDTAPVDPVHPHSAATTEDITVIKLSKASGAYQWHTFWDYLSYKDFGNSIDVDGSGNSYVTGYSVNSVKTDQFINVLTFNSTGDLVNSLKYGDGTGTDKGGNSIKVIFDNPQFNGIYVTGYSSSSWTGPDPLRLDPLHGFYGTTDIFIMMLALDGTYTWHSFYGSVGTNKSNGIALDQLGNIYITGSSTNNWLGPNNKLPPYNADDVAPIHDHSISSSPNPDIVVLKLDNTGKYQWHTFFGSPSDDYGRGIAVDQNNNISIVGESWAGWQGPAPALQNPVNMFAGGTDMVVLKLKTSGGYLWHSFYGSSGNDSGYGIAVSKDDPLDPYKIDVVGKSSNLWNFGAVGPKNNPPGSPNPAITVLQLGPSPATVSVSSSQSLLYYTQAVTFTATVSSLYGFIPSGTIDFSINGTPYAGFALINGQAKLTSSTLPAGLQLPITANYSGDSDLTPSSNLPLHPFYQDVSKAVTRLIVSSTANPSIYGQPLDLTVQLGVFPASAVPVNTGNVTFTVYTGEAKTTTLIDVANGSAVLSLNGLNASNHPVDISYSGDSNYAAVLPMTWGQVVSPVLTSIQLVLPTAPVYAGQPMTFSAKVNALPGSLGQVSGGSVLFQVDGFSMQPMPVTNGSTLPQTAPGVVAGSHTITATYSQANYGSSSSAQTLTIAKANPTVQLSPSANPSIVSHPVTLTITVLPPSDSTGIIPTGKVTLYQTSPFNGLSLSQPKLLNPDSDLPLNNKGIATLNLNLPAGTYSIIAIYTGDTNFNSATANPLTQVVNWLGLFLPTIMR